MNTFNLNSFNNSQAGLNNNEQPALGKPYFMRVKLGGVQLPNEPLLTFSRQKKIVQTTITGSQRQGTVKELISSSDYKIDLRGWCINPAVKEYPKSQVEQIIQLCERPEALEIENKLCDYFGIYRIVITSYDFADMQGKPYSQAYQISMVSDEDFYAELKNKE